MRSTIFIVRLTDDDAIELEAAPWLDLIDPEVAEALAREALEMMRAALQHAGCRPRGQLLRFVGGGGEDDKNQEGAENATP